MPSKPVQVSIDVDLLRRIDRDPETRERGRSAFIRSAAELYLDAKNKRSVDAQLRRAYAGVADSLLEEIEDLVSAQSWPDP